MEENSTENRQHWPKAIKQLDAEVKAKARANEDGCLVSGLAASCGSCRTITISFLFYYLTLNTAIAALAVIYHATGDVSPEIWWTGFMIALGANILLSVVALVVMLLTRASLDRRDPELGGRRVGAGADDDSASYKTVLTINSKTLQSNPADESNPGANQIAASAALAAATNKVTKSPANFPKLSTDSATQNFSNLTPSGSSPPSVILMDMKKDKRQKVATSPRMGKAYKSEPKLRVKTIERDPNQGKDARAKKKAAKQVKKKKSVH